MWCNLTFTNGNWAAIDIKLGGEKLIEEGVTKLNRLKNKLASNSDEKSPFLWWL